MNNTKNILLVVFITATLVLGTSVIPMQSYAGEDKNTKDSKSSIKASSEVDKKSASQKMDQDNFCYRGDDCQQANQGQQIVGKDNEAKGFNDQSKNIQQSVTPTQPPTTGTLNVCKTVVNLPTTSFQPSDFTFTFTTPGNPTNFQGANEGCTAVTVEPGTYTFVELFPEIVTQGTSDTAGGCFITGIGSRPVATIIVGTIAVGETQTCTVTNTVFSVTP